MVVVMFRTIAGGKRSDVLGGIHMQKLLEHTKLMSVVLFCKHYSYESVRSLSFTLFSPNQPYSTCKLSF